VQETDLLEPGVLDLWSGDPREILAVLRPARQLATESSRPEEWTISMNVTEPSWVIVSQLADPQWRARWERPLHPTAGEQELLPAFRKAGESGGWQRVKVPAPGHWTLRLEYDARDVAEGLAISTIAWMSWITATIVTGFRAARGKLRGPSYGGEA
jgi:hypothetical protein